MKSASYDRFVNGISSAPISNGKTKVGRIANACIGQLTNLSLTSTRIEFSDNDQVIPLHATNTTHAQRKENVDESTAASVCESDGSQNSDQPDANPTTAPTSKWATFTKRLKNIGLKHDCLKVADKTQTWGGSEIFQEVMSQVEAEMELRRSKKRGYRKAKNYSRAISTMQEGIGREDEEEEDEDEEEDDEDGSIVELTGNSSNALQNSGVSGSFRRTFSHQSNTSRQSSLNKSKRSNRSGNSSIVKKKLTPQVSNIEVFIFEFD